MKSKSVKVLWWGVALALGTACGGKSLPLAPVPEDPRGAYLVRDERTGDATERPHSEPRDLMNLGTTLLFTRRDGVHGNELWTTDGSAQGTALMMDLLPGIRGSEPNAFTRADDGSVYFVAQTTFAREVLSPRPPDTFALFRNRGTAESTTLLLPLPTRPAFVVAASGGVYLAAPDFSDPRDDTPSLGLNGPREVAASLWFSDGTPEGSRKLAVNGRLSMNTSAAPLGNALLFTVRDPGGGWWLWRTDGTPEGTLQVAALYLGRGGHAPRRLTAMGGQVLFWAGDLEGQGRTVLWRSDGTPAGTRPVANIAPSRTSDQDGFFVRDGVAFFSGEDPRTGKEPWRTDGTPEGTALIADLNPGPSGSEPIAFTRQGAWVYFVVRGVPPLRLYRTDGTRAGTTLMSGRLGRERRDLEPSEGRMIATDDALFFLGTTSEGQPLQLWRAGATAEATAVSDPLPASMRLQIMRGGALYLTSNGVDGLWTHGGKAGPVTQVLPALSLPASSWNEAMGATEAVDLGGTLYFARRDPIDWNIRRLWKSDGTAAGTVQARPASTGPYGRVLLSPEALTVVNGQLLFTAAAPELGVPDSLWRYDPASGNATRLASRMAVWTTATDPRLFTSRPLITGSQAWFMVASGQTTSTVPNELWKTDGTEAGTVRLKAFLGPYSATNLMPVGSRLFFTVSKSPGNTELWISDGTEAGTLRLMAPELDGFILGGAAMGDHLFFWVQQGSEPVKLWKSDGTSEGTVAVGIMRGAQPLPMDPGVALGDAFYFPCRSDRGAPQLCWSHGQSMGRTTATFGPEGTALMPSHLTVQEDHLLFWAATPSNGHALWRMGPGGDTTLLMQAQGRLSAVATPAPLVRSRPGGPFLFAASDGVSGLELWKTNGTPEGTVRAVDIAPGRLSSSPGGTMVPSGDRVYFPAWTPAHGRELWALPMP